jgi:hypothetical protein
MNNHNIYSGNHPHDHNSCNGASIQMPSTGQLLSHTGIYGSHTGALR